MNQTLFSSPKNLAYIIAEIGGNFTTLAEAEKLIDAAKFAGVDCVKIQTYRAETLSSENAVFDMENTGVISQFEFFKKYEISKELHREVFAYAESKGLDWFSTPSHKTDVDMLEELGVKAYKIGADDATNLPLLKYIARLGKPIFFSTGMCTMEEIKESINTILEEGNSKIVIFHTVSGYPTHPKDVHLNVIKTFIKEFPEFPIGFSDHSLTITACIAAASIGAKVLERHFTLDKKAEGPDHMLSSTPDEMKYLIDSIRTIETMMGAGIKMPVGSEVKNRANNRKSIVVTQKIKKGELLTNENIDCKRPGNGIQPKYYFQVLNKTATRDLAIDEILNRRDFK